MAVDVNPESDDLSELRRKLLANLERSIEQAHRGEMFSEEEVRVRMAERRRALAST